MNPPGPAPGGDDAAKATGQPKRPPAKHEAAPTSANVPTVPDYELLRRVGGGAYGDVWLARSNATGAFRAAKIVWRNRFEDERPFQREFEGIKHFEKISREHPSQLALFHIGRNDAEGYFYYVMELADPVEDSNSEIRGPKEIRKWKSETASPEATIRASDLYTPRTLRAELDHRRLPAARVLELGLALSEALGHLHRHGLVHRDVKPSNVIFVNGQPKLADIGLVTDASDQCSIVGTEGYLPPEGPGAPPADIFALGKVLYEAATGLDRREFPKLPEDLRSWPDVKQVFELNEIVLKACESEPRLRYKSCEEMLDELEHLTQGRSVKGRRVLHQRLYVVRKASVTAATIVLLAAGAIFLWRMVTGYNSPVVLGNEVLLSHNSEAIKAYNVGMPWLLRATPDGYRIALENFSRASELDPKFVNAYARLFETYLLCEDRGVTRPAGQAESLAGLAAKLQTLAPTNADTHAAMAVVRFLNQRRWNDAETEFNQALAADPNCRMALTYYGYFLTRLQRAREAREVLERAQNLYPSSPVIAKFIGHCEYEEHHFEDALLLYARVHNELEPAYPSSHYWAGRALMAMTNYVAGLREFQKNDELQGNLANITKRYDGFQKSVDQDGPRGFWAALIAEQKANESNTPPYAVATRYAMLPDKGQALKWLKIAQEKNEGMENLLFDDCWDAYRREPEFRKVVKSVGLEPWEKL